MNRILLRYELLGLMRDTRTVVLSVLLPIILLPILLFTLQRFGLQRLGMGETEYRYGRAVPSPGLQRLAEAAFEKSPLSESLVANNETKLAEGSLDLVLKVGQPEVVSARVVEDIGKAFPGLSALVSEDKPGRPVVELLYRSDHDRSVQAYIRAQERLLDFREKLLQSFFKQAKAEVGIELESRDVSSAQDRAARRYGPALACFMILILLGGGSVAALDSLAGERERGTLSTLFLSSLPRRDLIWTKFGAVAIISVIVAVVQMLNLSAYVVFGWMKLPFATTLGQGAVMLVSLSLLFLSEALFTAALLLYISARSGSFKEAQLFFFPTFLIAFALSLSGLMPGLPTRSVVSLVPLAGPGLLVPEILASHLDIPILLLQIAVQLGAAYFLVASTLAYVNREEFLGGQPPSVGKALLFEQFSQRALPMYALLGASLMVIPSNFAGLSNLQGQAFFNQMILFGLAPYLLLRVYKQKLRDAVPMRAVSPKIWVACLVLIPLGQVAATGLSHLLSPLLPPPVKALEEMMEFLNLKDTPSWQLYLMIGLLPGFFEEFAFRGVLLHALHRRFTPWKLAVVTAFVFGLFHLSFYRVLPTAFLGFFLAVITLSTGSVLPGMLVHAGNNSLAVTGMIQGWDVEGLSAFAYAAAFVAFLGIIALIMRWGRGYPGTLWSRPDSRADRLRSGR